MNFVDDRCPDSGIVIKVRHAPGGIVNERFEKLVPIIGRFLCPLDALTADIVALIIVERDV